METNDNEHHCLIDAIPTNDELEEEPALKDVLFDSETVIQKALADSEQNASKKLMDTRSYKGDLTRFFPNKGKFPYCHIDFDGKGGFVKLIDDERSFGQTGLRIVAEGPLG